MKSNLLLTLIILFFKCGYSQNKAIIDSLYQQAKAREITIYDSLNHRFEKIQYSKFGEKVSVERIDLDGFTLIDTTFGFYQNGRIAYFRIFMNNMPHGNFTVYDSLGNIRYKGAYYKRYRIGEWKCYNENNRVTKSVIYKYNLSDSLIIDQLILSGASTDNLLLIDEINLRFVRANDVFIKSVNMFSYGEVVKIKCRCINSNYMKGIFDDGVMNNKCCDS